MAIKTVNKDSRSITTTWKADDEGREFYVYTYHSKDYKEFRTATGRRVVRDGIVREVIDMRNDDPNPINRRTVTPVGRYSLKAMEIEHDDFLAAFVAGADQIKAHTEWAKRAMA